MVGLLMSLFGMGVLLIVAVLCSENRRAINLRTVSGAFIIQFALGAFVLYSTWGQNVLEKMTSGVQKIYNYGDEGIGFLFGSLVNFSVDGIGFIFAFKVLPTIIFFSALIAVLYHIGAMQIVIRVLGGSLQKLLGTSRAESMSASANIFVGQTEAPLVVRPFVPNMTRSELFAVMCGGLASVAGGVMAGYAAMGVPLEYLIAASFMAAPGGLLFAKILIPETQLVVDQVVNNGKSKEKLVNDTDNDKAEDKPANVIDAAATGASSGLLLALNVGAMLLAFIGLIALINGILGGVGDWFGMQGLTLELILGYIFAPVAWVIGVPWNEAILAGSFIGQKTVLNEFVAYSSLQPYLQGATEVVLTEKTKAIISFALCGFANLSSIAILLGGLGGIAPTRRSEIAQMGMKAILAGTLSNLMAATIAGFCITLQSL